MNCVPPCIHCVRGERLDVSHVMRRRGGKVSWHGNLWKAMAHRFYGALLTSFGPDIYTE